MVQRTVRRISPASAYSCLLLTTMIPACSGATEETAQPIARPAPSPLPALSQALLTTDLTLLPLLARQEATSLNPGVPNDRAELLAEGYGDFEPSDALPLSVHTLWEGPAKTLSSGAKLLTRFAFLADAQLADDESPARLAELDTPAATSGAFRPQEGHECRILNAAVRTLNAVNEAYPIEFVLLGGDNADNAQENELDWFQAILDGEEIVECDSGNDDDPVPGPDNDPKDAFVPEGLKMPWRWVTGNHDILNQGTLPIAIAAERALGESSATGTRDWSIPGAPIRSGQVVADQRRALMDRTTLLEKLAAKGDGHGISDATISYGKAFYSFDLGEGKIRVVVLDTAAETGSADGMMHQADVDDFVRPALDQAASEGKFVILVSHHASGLFTDGSGAGGTKQDDALTTDTFREFVGSYDNILLHLAGHTHVHRLTEVQPSSGNTYYELESSALADFPHQVRLVEIHEDGDYFVIRSTCVDYSTEGDPVAEEGRKLGIVDYTAGWSGDGTGMLTDRNVELWIPLTHP